MAHVHYNTAVLNSIPMPVVAGKLAKVYRKGSAVVTSCPWHEDKHPSLTLYDSHCHCFACGAHGKPVSYVMQKLNVDFLGACEWLSANFGKGATDMNQMKTEIEKLPKATKEAGPVAYIPIEYVRSMMSSSNSFCNCLYQMFDSAKVDMIAEEYMLGTWQSKEYDDDVMFPSIDEQGRVHNIKIQHYCTDRDSDSFCSCDKQHILWIGKDLIRQGIVPRGSSFDNDCLFGAHLLPRYPDKTVRLVESPKNALLGAMHCPQYLWVATGNKGSLNSSTLAPLKGRNVTVFPDRDAIQEWREKLEQFAWLANFVVSDFCEKMAPSEEKKYDIADFLLSAYKSG